jgi:hypothetical protein
LISFVASILKRTVRSAEEVAMKRFYRVVPVVFAALIVFTGAAAGQSITGAVSDEGAYPLRGILVSFFDSAGAEPIAVATTDFNGLYSSGLIPPGSYRVEFSGGNYYPTFFGAGGLHNYCLGTLVPVASHNTTSGVSEVMRLSTPERAVEYDYRVEGLVVNAVTGVPLAGIKVSILDAVDAALIAEGTTGPDGTYTVDVRQFGNNTARVKFSDPGSNYFPQFFGAATLDFCAAGILTTGSGKLGADASMQPIPSQVAETLIEQVNNLGLPGNVTSTLATPLVKAADLLKDGNANNDQAVCAHLGGFITRVEIEEKRGQLSPAEAADLRASAEALQTTLGCR